MSQGNTNIPPAPAGTTAGGPKPKAVKKKAKKNVSTGIAHIQSTFNNTVVTITDLIRCFTESDIVEVQPQLSSAVAEREDIALLQFRTASGVLAHINTNWLTPFKARNVTVATRGKYVMGDLLTRQVTECFGFKPDGSYSMRHLPVGYDEPLRAELIAFLRAVRGEVPAVTGGEGVASLEIAIRCLENPPRPAASSPPRKGPRRVVG